MTTGFATRGAVVAPVVVAVAVAGAGDAAYAVVAASESEAVVRTRASARPERRGFMWAMQAVVGVVTVAGE
jgi:hypothetical protein